MQNAQINIIEISGLSKSFKARNTVKHAVIDLSFSVRKGETFGFLGPNGAGKSTTIKIIMDFIRADRGFAVIDGIDSKLLKSRSKIGFMPENPVYQETLTGKELLYFVASLYGVSKGEAKRKAEELLVTLDLKDAADRKIRHYSKGMIQRIGFAASIIHDPDILILDEPMSGLDPMGRYVFKNVMKELNSRGKTIFFSSHIIPDIEDVCKRVGIISNGAMVRIIEREEAGFFEASGFSITARGDLNKMISENISVESIGENVGIIQCEKRDFAGVVEKIKLKNLDIIDIKPIKKDLESLFVQIIENEKR